MGSLEPGAPCVVQVDPFIYIYIYRIYVDLHISIHGAFRTFDVINLVSFLYLDPVIYFCRT